MIHIDGLGHYLDALSRLDLLPVQHDALGEAAERLAIQVRDSLSHPPGADHATPWLRSGELRASIVAEAETGEAVVGSSDPVAVYQENGTATVPPRPFLAPAGAAGAEIAADDVGRTIAGVIQEALR